ncbi:hypothetical protein TruAng_009007 [Truncatella angustata]|nr:hypothetical protein TruAng_009007 [Truncatella angustata]
MSTEDIVGTLATSVGKLHVDDGGVWRAIDHIYKRRPLYRVVYRGTPRMALDGDVTARLTKGSFPSDERLREYLKQHENRDSKVPTPFISVTPSLSWVMSLCSFHDDPEDRPNVRILIIDPRSLESGSCCNLKALHEYISPGGDFTRYKSEFLIWKRIPSRAIVSTWQWEDIRSNVIFGTHIPIDFPQMQNEYKTKWDLALHRRRAEKERNKGRKQFHDDLIAAICNGWDPIEQGKQSLSPLLWYVVATVHAWWAENDSKSSFEIFDRHIRPLSERDEFRDLVNACDEKTGQSVVKYSGAQANPDFWSWAHEAEQLRGKYGFWSSAIPDAVSQPKLNPRRV